MIGVNTALIGSITLFRNHSATPDHAVLIPSQSDTKSFFIGSIRESLNHAETLPQISLIFSHASEHSCFTLSHKPEKKDLTFSHCRTMNVTSPATAAISAGIQLPVSSEIPSPAARIPATTVSVFSSVTPFSMMSLIPTTSRPTPPTISEIPAATFPNASARPPATAARPPSIPMKLPQSMPLFHASSQL